MNSSLYMNGFRQVQERLIRERFRLLTLVGAVFVPLYSLVDYIFYPEFWERFLVCRLTISAMCLALYIADRSPLGGQWIVRAGLCIYYLLGACIIWMIVTVNGHGTPYYAGLTLMFVGFCAIIPYRTRHLVMHVGALYLLYLAAVFSFGPPPNPRLLLVQNIFMVSTVIVVLVAANYNFRLRFNEFHLRKELDEAREQLKAYATLLEERVAESEAQYATLVNNSDEAIFVLENRRIAFPNPCTSELLGCPREELNRFDFIDFVHHDHRATVEDAYRRIEHQKDSISLDTIKIQAKDGTLRYVTLSIVRIHWHGHNALLHFVRDVSERRRLEAELLQAQKMEAVGTLAGGVAHDINNVLHIIMGYVQLLQTRYGDPSGFLEKIGQVAERAENITKQLLLYSRKVESHKEELDVNSHIRGVCTLLERTISRMVSIEQRLQEDLPPIYADPVQFDQVIMNLAVNARDAMPDGGVLTIETSELEIGSELPGLPTLKPGSYVVVRMSDTGCGMDEATLSRMFDPFFTTKEEGAGTGLGLAIVYGIVKKHGGFIHCTSNPGKGTTFSIYFPVALQDGGHARGLVKKGLNSDSKSIKGNGETILVIDDEPGILEVEKEMLTACNYRVVTAASGEEAVELFRRQGSTIDAVILDLNMPGMGGHNCLRELKAIRPDIKVMIATGYAGDSHIREVQVAGADDIIQKPFRIEEIIPRIRALLRSDGEASEGPGVDTSQAS